MNFCNFLLLRFRVIRSLGVQLSVHVDLEGDKQLKNEFTLQSRVHP